MGFFSFKTPSAKRFEYRPRYYNPNKEAFDVRMERIRDEVESEKSGKEHQRLSIRDVYDAYRGKRGKAPATTASRIRLFVIVLSVVLLLAFFYLFGILMTYFLQND